MSRTFGAGVRVAAIGLATATALTFSGPAFAGENAGPRRRLRRREPQAAVTAPSPALLAGSRRCSSGFRPPRRPRVAGRHARPPARRLVPERPGRAGAAGRQLPRDVRRRSRHHQGPGRSRRSGVRGQITMRPRTQLLALGALAALLLAPPVFGAADVIVVNVDAAGTGFNDPTPATPVGGNSGHHGRPAAADRLPVRRRPLGIDPRQHGADQRPGLLSRRSPATPTSGVLGSTAPIQVFANFPHAKLREHLVPRGPRQQDGGRRPGARRDRTPTPTTSSPSSTATSARRTASRG